MADRKKVGVISLVGRVLAPEDLGLRVVTVDRGRITRIGPPEEAGPDTRGGSRAWIVPGLVDLQLNGAFGVDFADPHADLARVATALPSTGVTAFLPTLVSSAADVYPACLRNLSAPIPHGAARAVGIHLEGPFLAPARLGVHDSEAVRAPDLGELRSWLASGQVRIVTLAPELPGADLLIAELVARGVVASIGHSDATWHEADGAIAGGVRLGTHLFNAMRPFHHREPGIVGRLLEPGVMVTVIADGVHVAPHAVRLAAAAKGEELILVTDGVAALGAPPGRYRFGRREVVSDGIVARLVDGTIAGSALPLAPALGRLVTAGIDASVVVRAASTTPAQLLGMEDELGRIEVGRVADLVLLDAEWNPTLTLVQGDLADEGAPQPSRVRGA